MITASPCKTFFVLCCFDTLKPQSYFLLQTILKSSFPILSHPIPIICNILIICRHNYFYKLFFKKVSKIDSNLTPYYWDYHKTYKQTKPKNRKNIRNATAPSLHCTTGRTKRGEIKRTRYIIVIQSDICYNFNIIDSGKPIFRRINLLWK